MTIDHRKRVEESVQEGSYNAITTKNVGEAIYRTKSHHYSVAPPECAASRAEDIAEIQNFVYRM